MLKWWSLWSSSDLNLSRRSVKTRINQINDLNFRRCSHFRLLCVSCVCVVLSIFVFNNCHIIRRYHLFLSDFFLFLSWSVFLFLSAVSHCLEKCVRSGVAASIDAVWTVNTVENYGVGVSDWIDAETEICPFLVQNPTDDGKQLLASCLQRYVCDRVAYPWTQIPKRYPIVPAVFSHLLFAQHFIAPINTGLFLCGLSGKQTCALANFNLAFGILFFLRQFGIYNSSINGEQKKSVVPTPPPNKIEQKQRHKKHIHKIEYQKMRRAANYSHISCAHFA